MSVSTRQRRYLRRLAASTSEMLLALDEAVEAQRAADRAEQRLAAALKANLQIRKDR